MTPITINDEEAIRLVEELAALEGESTTTVVIEAVRDRLDRKRTPPRDESRVQYFLELGRRVRETADPAWLATDPVLDLYDDDGLPR